MSGKSLREKLRDRRKDMDEYEREAVKGKAKKKKKEEEKKLDPNSIEAKYERVRKLKEARMRRQKAREQKRNPNY